MWMLWNFHMGKHSKRLFVISILLIIEYLVLLGFLIYYLFIDDRILEGIINLAIEDIEGFIYLMSGFVILAFQVVCGIVCSMSSSEKNRGLCIASSIGISFLALMFGIACLYHLESMYALFFLLATILTTNILYIYNAIWSVDSIEKENNRVACEKGINYMKKRKTGDYVVPKLEDDNRKTKIIKKPESLSDEDLF